MLERFLSVELTGNDLSFQKVQNTSAKTTGSLNGNAVYRFHMYTPCRLDDCVQHVLRRLRPDVSYPCREILIKKTNSQALSPNSKSSNREMRRNADLKVQAEG